MIINFFVPGQARPAGSKSAFKYKKIDEVTGQESQGIAVTHANPATKQWMDSVRFFAMKASNRMVPVTGPVRLWLVFLKDRPAAHFGSGRNEGSLKTSAPQHMTKTPDLTKLTRAVEDGITGIIWKDDSQVVQQITCKRYCRGDEIAGVQIVIETINETKGVCYDKEITKQEPPSLFECPWGSGSKGSANTFN